SGQTWPPPSASRATAGGCSGLPNCGRMSPFAPGVTGSTWLPGWTGMGRSGRSEQVQLFSGLRKTGSEPQGGLKMGGRLIAPPLAEEHLGEAIMDFGIVGGQPEGGLVLFEGLRQLA